MRTIMLALTLTCAAAAVQAQSSLQVYGSVDAGIIKRSDQSLTIGKRAHNTLGFKGMEDIGSGLKAVFELEMRYEPDTGQLEAGAGGTQRPLFQGASRVGLTGGFGTLRLGRGLTAFQESSMAFEPFRGIPSPSGFQTDLMVGGAYSSDPLGQQGIGANRFSNALFYNSPELNGLQLNATVGTRETAGAPAAANPFSISTTYRNGPAALLLAYERNGVEHTVKSVAGYVYVTPETKVMASLSHQNQSPTRVLNQDTKAWVVGANHTLGASKILAGYGQKQVDGLNKVKQFSLGYEYSLSKRTFIYADVSNKKGVPAVAPGTGTSVNHYSLGVNHAF